MNSKNAVHAQLFFEFKQFSKNDMRLSGQALIYIYFFDNKKHNKPHIHVKYAGSEVVLGLPDGEIMEGSIPNNKMKLVEAWIEIHKEDLLANWELAVNGQEVFKIEPLK